MTASEIDSLTPGSCENDAPLALSVVSYHRGGANFCTRQFLISTV